MDEAKHTRLVRPIANAYALTTLVEFEPFIDSTSRTFVEQVRNRFVKTGKEFSLETWCKMYAFDVMLVRILP